MRPTKIVVKTATTTYILPFERIVEAMVSVWACSELIERRVAKNKKDLSLLFIADFFFIQYL